MFEKAQFTNSAWIVKCCILSLGKDLDLSITYLGRVLHWPYALDVSVIKANRMT